MPFRKNSLRAAVVRAYDKCVLRNDEYFFAVLLFHEFFGFGDALKTIRIFVLAFVRKNE